MLHKKTIFFLGPVPWLFHNRQIPLFADKLSEDYNVIYFDCSSLGGYTISFLEFLSFKNRVNYKFFLKALFEKKLPLVSNPIIITILTYKEKQQLFWFDKFLFKLQIAIIAKITSNKKFIIWTSTLQFDNLWKSIANATWVFDYFDRFPMESDEILKTERWLLKSSKAVFVNSQVYREITEKTFGRAKRGKMIVTPVGYFLKPYLTVFPNPKKKKIIVGYGGGLSDRLDFPLIISSVKLNPEIQFIFAGPIYEKSLHTKFKPYTTSEFVHRLKNFSNVKIIPVQKGTSGIKKVMSKFSIGWIPYNTKVLFNKYSTPTKFYEYCAFGMPTISTRLKILNEYPGLVYFIDSAGQLKQLIKNILSKESMSRIKKRKDFAKFNDINNKYKKVKQALKEID